MNAKSCHTHPALFFGPKSAVFFHTKFLTVIRYLQHFLNGQPLGENMNSEDRECRNFFSSSFLISDVLVYGSHFFFVGQGEAGG